MIFFSFNGFLLWELEMLVPGRLYLTKDVFICLVAAVRVLTNRSRSPEDVQKLMRDVILNMDASSSASSAALIPTVTDSNLDSNPLTRTVDTTTTASAEGAPYIARNIPGGEGRSIMVEMIPQPSPNQTGRQQLTVYVWKVNSNLEK